MSIYQPFCFAIGDVTTRALIEFYALMLILTSSMSGKGKIPYWQAFSNAGNSIHLGSVPLESTVTDEEEEYIKLYYSVTDIIRLTE